MHLRNYPAGSCRTPTACPSLTQVSPPHTAAQKSAQQTSLPHSTTAMSSLRAMQIMTTDWPHLLSRHCRGFMLFCAILYLSWACILLLPGRSSEQALS